eukprot:m.210758 g.210758  ORF g.210758 m.210758 type:complete len:295 (+) comp19019_c0_seq1:132-1016(+)
MASSDAGATEFCGGERVLAFHGPVLYESKILAVEKRKDAEGKEITVHLTHYNGWNKHWDEWLPPDRLRKINAETLQLKSNLEAEYSSSNKRKGPAGKRIGDDGTKKTRRRDRGDTGGASSADDIRGLLEDKVVLPDALKVLLVDDWHFITAQSKIVKLPRAHSIAKILAEYCEHAATHHGPRAAGVAAEVTSGLKVYFENGCAAQLLYAAEQAQHAELVRDTPTARLCDHYGPQHLLRLFVKLPAMMEYAGVSPKGACYLVTCLQDILEYLHAHKDKFFATDAYITHSPPSGKK